jgi:CBS-domain-containing membrane protein
VTGDFGKRSPKCGSARRAAYRSRVLAPALLALAVLILVALRTHAVAVAVSRHDQRIRYHDYALVEWVARNDGVVAQQLYSLTNDVQIRGGEDDTMLRVRRDTKAQAMNRYRHELERADRLRRELASSERIAHRAWRRLTRHPLPEFTTPSRVAGVVARWQEPEDSLPPHLRKKVA